MKKRYGFVSNSSSSSFCCFTTKEISDKAEATLTDGQRDTLNADNSPLFLYNLAGMILIGYESFNTAGDSWAIGQHNSQDCAMDDMERFQEATLAWKDAVKNVGGNNAIVEIDIDL